MSASWKKAARTIGFNNLIDRVAMVEDQNVNLQIALAAISTYFGKLPNGLQKKLDGVLKEAQANEKATQKSLLDAVVKTTQEWKVEHPDEDIEAANEAGALGRQKVLEGAAGEVVSVRKEFVNE